MNVINERMEGFAFFLNFLVGHSYLLEGMGVWVCTIFLDFFLFFIFILSFLFSFFFSFFLLSGCLNSSVVLETPALLLWLISIFPHSPPSHRVFWEFHSKKKIIFDIQLFNYTPSFLFFSLFFSLPSFSFYLFH